jgi:hypothetical protein
VNVVRSVTATKISAAVLTATCPASKRVIGGGGFLSNPNIAVTINEPSDRTGTGWTFGGQNVTNKDQSTAIEAWAICAIVR